MTTVTIPQAFEIALSHHQAGRLTEAEPIYRQILAQQPTHADVLHLLGVLVIQTGHAESGVALIQRAIAQAPAVADYHSNLCNGLIVLRRLEAAVDAGHAALRLRPDFPEAYNNLGNAFKDKGQLDEAIAAYRQAVRLKPDYAVAYNNLGNGFKYRRQLDEAIDAYRQALRLKPDYAMVHHNLVYALHLHPAYDALAILEAARQWNQQCAVPFAPPLRPHNNPAAPGRRLKIGYVSPDMREHPVGRFLLPLLAAHHHRWVEIYCYTDVTHPDTITERLRRRADHWRNIAGLSHEQTAELIRKDGIDILVDLTMHTADNRLPVFARRPAPVQVTYLAFCSTTGLDGMDYRLTDPYLDPPPGTSERADGEGGVYSAQQAVYSERSVWLPETYWCYPPPDDAPEVGPLPAEANGYVTFGCLNSFTKVSDTALTAWCQLMQAVPESRLLLHAREGSHRQRVRDQFAGQGVDPKRLSFAGMVPQAAYLGLYEGVDIGLDPFPYNGGTTTCDALWMGVPVVSLAGRTAVGRGGLSLLTNVGLPELVAGTVEQYIEIAASLAQDLDRLSALRGGLRARMRCSPLMNAPRFARGVEAAYRHMWIRWCRDGQAA